MGAGKTKRPTQNLAAGRPPVLKKPQSMSRKSTRALINSLHNLEKRKQQATARGDDAEIARITAEVVALGGIDKYQQASLQGQRRDRGGDSSSVLLNWLKPIEPSIRPPAATFTLRMLEVGALSTSNACARSRLFDVERIDLNSREQGIQQQDFMKRPLPKDDSDRFHVISLSLVLNFVPDPTGRGDMLRRTLNFLHAPLPAFASPLDSYFPCLFMVLPAPCIQNSRYLDDAKLQEIMSCIGFEMIQAKMTQKLAYYLWRRTAAGTGAMCDLPKVQLRRGSWRNNFAIVLKPS
ncbi:25S rRNA adenine-N(1) methyltransferase [Pleurostoma richardsiae]|uniref:25S rRNA adenine-N(1) methyltransferase n=1 Tax=Pleurostoma richardsiae TaxID=41990 RepID=A0AA38RYN2_9PEZI|nr:25S rRNA adenine-N(1) methyltransferase [Pleurostoma richardsiae]